MTATAINRGNGVNFHIFTDQTGTYVDLFDNEGRQAYASVTGVSYKVGAVGPFRDRDTAREFGLELQRHGSAEFPQQ